MFGAIFSSKWMNKLVSLLTDLISDTIERKILTGDHTGDGVITDLTFNNLVIGQVYTIKLHLRATYQASSSYILQPVNGSAMVSVDLKSTNGIKQLNALDWTFTATSTTLTFETSSYDSGESINTGTTVDLIKRKLLKFV